MYKPNNILTLENSPPCRMICDLLQIMSSVPKSRFQSEIRLARSGSKIGLEAEVSVVRGTMWRHRSWHSDVIDCHNPIVRIVATYPLWPTLTTSHSIKYTNQSTNFRCKLYNIIGGSASVTRAKVVIVFIESSIILMYKTDRYIV